MYDTLTDDEKIDYTSGISFRTKVMTQDGSQIDYMANNDMTIPYFTNRLKTFLTPNMGQTYRINVLKQYIDFVDS